MRGIQYEHGTDTTWTWDQEGFPGEVERSRQNVGCPLWGPSWALAPPCRSGAWSHLYSEHCPLYLLYPNFPDASLTLSSLLLQSQMGPWGSGPNIYINSYFVHTGHVQAVTQSHSHIHTVESPQFRMCHHGHAASIDMHSPSLSLAY